MNPFLTMNAGFFVASSDGKPNICEELTSAVYSKLKEMKNPLQYSQWNHVVNMIPYQVLLKQEEHNVDCSTPIASSGLAKLLFSDSFDSKTLVNPNQGVETLLSRISHPLQSVMCFTVLFSADKKRLLLSVAGINTTIENTKIVSAQFKRSETLINYTQYQTKLDELFSKFPSLNGNPNYISVQPYPSVNTGEKESLVPLDYDSDRTSNQLYEDFKQAENFFDGSINKV